MLDKYARPLINPPLDKMGAALARMGFSANMMTVSGLVVGLFGAVAISIGAFTTGLIFVLLSRLLDGLDGAVARATKKTDFGGYLDITCDFIFYGAVPLAFIIYNPAGYGIIGGFLLASFYGNGASFLGYAVLAEKHGDETSSQGEKSLYYSNGILEGTETVIFFTLICLIPSLFNILGFVFAALTVLTMCLRIAGAWQIYGDDSESL